MISDKNLRFSQIRFACVVADRCYICSIAYALAFWSCWPVADVTALQIGLSGMCDLELIPAAGVCVAVVIRMQNVSAQKISLMNLFIRSALYDGSYDGSMTVLLTVKGSL